MNRLPVVIFFCASAAEVLLPLWGVEGLWFSKPLIMIGLIFHYFHYAKNRHTPFILAMIACWAGDILLLWSDQIFFMLGLVGFLIGQILYIISYRAHRHATSTNELYGPQKVRFSLPFVLAGTGLVVVLYPVLGELQVPVMIYALVLTVMVLQALFRFGRTSVKSFGFVFGGAICFMVSDSLLAINKFLDPLPLANTWVMFTYCLAQYLIVEGILSHNPKD